VRFTVVLLSLVLASPTAAQRGGRQQPDAFVEKIPGSLVTLEMLPVPGGTVQMATAAGPRTITIAPFWIAKTEISWELYDVYVFGLDESAGDSVDAVARPTRPYVLPGEEFGHAGRPVIGMTFLAATSFAEWLSAHTGRHYRLATEAEWRHACTLGMLDRDAATSDVWHRGNADDRTRSVRGGQPDALGLHDMRGNVAEWVNGEDGDPVAVGGAFTDLPDDVHCGARKKQTPAWNATDPQLPKSRWWLPDAVFVGFRVIRVR
jgi:formylglycine-generating enzyme required for sulfatase activity